MSPHGPKQRRQSLSQATVDTCSTGYSSRSGADMETVLEAFRMVEVKDRKSRLATYKECFVGSDAVDVLVSMGYARSRAEAVKLGQLVSAEYELFESVPDKSHSFEDSNQLYRFKSQQTEDQFDENDIGMQSPSTEKPLSKKALRRVVTALQEVDVRDRKHKLKTHKQCFLGNEAVDVLVSAGCVRSRDQAVKILRKVSKRYGIFEPVNGDHEFDDDYLFFRFKEARPAETYVSSNESVCSRSVCSRTSVQSMDSQYHATTVGLHAVVKTLRTVEVDDYKHGSKVFKGCFLGNEAVDKLVSAGHAKTREEAVRIGRAIADKYDLFENIQGGHKFEDKSIPYRFKSKPSQSRAMKGENDPSSCHEQNRKIIDGLAKIISQEAEVKDRKTLLKTYKRCFVGAEVVDMLLAKGIAKSRQDAVRLGRVVERDLDLFEHVKGEREFDDGPYFYRFKR